MREFDYGWLGQHQRGIEHTASIGTIEMGARQYVPTLGRFLEVDPVEGGSDNDYDYAEGDPVNGLDISGEDPCDSFATRWTGFCRDVRAISRWAAQQAHKKYGGGPRQNAYRHILLAAALTVQFTRPGAAVILAWHERGGRGRDRRADEHNNGVGIRIGQHVMWYNLDWEAARGDIIRFANQAMEGRGSFGHPSLDSDQG